MKERPDINEESLGSSDEEDLTGRPISIKHDKKKATDKGIANRLSMFRRRTLSVTLKNSIFVPNYWYVGLHFR